MAELDFASDSDLIQVWREGPAAHVRLNPPEKANAYNQAMLGAIEKFVRRVSADPEIRVVVISGAGDRAFCAGADLNELEQRDWRAALNLRSADAIDRSTPSSFISRIRADSLFLCEPGARSISLFSAAKVSDDRGA